MLDEASLRNLLARVERGDASVDDALASLRKLPFENLGHTTLDHHRALRTGHAEVVYCAGKTAAQVADIVEKLAERNPRVLGTRATREQYEAAKARVPALRYHELARCICTEDDSPKLPGVMVMCAGTSDLPVAEEAAVTLEAFGHGPHRVVDVGVAGLHRTLAHLDAIQSASVIVVVAGMEGALPSVIGGLTSAPVIAVPTSVGYGASFGGLSALLTMLNSCVSGVAVVNIDNGFGAGCLAANINRRIHDGPRKARGTADGRG